VSRVNIVISSDDLIQVLGTSTVCCYCTYVVLACNARIRSSCANYFCNRAGQQIVKPTLLVSPLSLLLASFLVSLAHHNPGQLPAPAGAMMRARKHVNAKSSTHEEGGTRDETDKSGRSSSVGSGSREALYTKIIAVILTLVVGSGFWFESYHWPSSSISVIDVPPFTSLIPPEVDATLVADADGQVYHVIFSTDCGSYQAWQSYMTFYRAMKVRQPGHVTRIASGCTDEEKKDIEAWFNHNIQHMSQRFHLQLTPHFSEVKDEHGNVIGDYKFFNKPFGLKYWLENSDLLDFDGMGNFPNTADAIVILIDPDMSLLRPITKDFTSDEDVVIADFRKSHIIGRTVEHGKPFAQAYGFGAQFLKLDMEKIGGKGTRLMTTTNEEGLLYYPVGPPYLATITDMYQISLKWTEFVPRVHEQYPHLLAEMFAFSLAAAHLDLKHQLVQSLMISDTHSGKGEGWQLTTANIHYLT
jgi:hypothetical protein